MKYRILRPSDSIQYGDERWDFKYGWMKMRDSDMERYRRAGKNAWRFRRPLTTIGNGHHERKGSAER